jgi:hypothetical protein
MSFWWSGKVAATEMKKMNKEELFFFFVFDKYKEELFGWWKSVKKVKTS